MQAGGKGPGPDLTSILHTMFVTLEGPEGAGKSTVIKELAERFSAQGLEVLVTREPGDGPVGKQIREILLHGEAIASRTELFLFLADRAQHVEAIVQPALARGVIVLCDRYSDSTLVYQGYGRGLDLGLLGGLNDIATGGLKPDLTLLLDLPPEVGLARQSSKDRLDNEPIEFHRKIRNGFLAEASVEPLRWVVVDAQQSVEDVVAACAVAIAAKLSS